jgi:hypothetical protein
MNRLEYQMASFQNALAALSAKVDAILSVIAKDSVALAEARQAAADATAHAEQVVSEDAAQDAADDSARADSLDAVSAKLDSVLNPVDEVPVEVPVEEAPVEAPVEEVPVEAPADVVVEEPTAEQ